MKVSIAERIRQGLEIRNMSQADLCRLTSIGKSSISQYISGDYEPKQQNIYRLAKALNVNESWLMGYDVKMDRELEKIEISIEERDILRKYNSLDQKGKHTVNTILDVEYNRCKAEEENMPIAAHGSMDSKNIINTDDLELGRKKKMQRKQETK